MKLKTKILGFLLILSFLTACFFFKSGPALGDGAYRPIPLMITGGTMTGPISLVTNTTDVACSTGVTPALQFGTVGFIGYNATVNRLCINSASLVSIFSSLGISGSFFGPGSDGVTDVGRSGVGIKNVYFSNAVTNFAGLGTPVVGTMLYCLDCAIASSPCTGTGTGTFAFRINGGTPAWKCL